MNRKVYEAVFFSLRSKESKLQSEIEGLFKTETPQPDVCERVESLLRTLVETEGALHTLKEKYVFETEIRKGVQVKGKGAMDMYTFK